MSSPDDHTQSNNRGDITLRNTSFRYEGLGARSFDTSVLIVHNRVDGRDEADVHIGLARSSDVNLGLDIFISEEVARALKGALNDLDFHNRSYIERDI